MEYLCCGLCVRSVSSEKTLARLKEKSRKFLAESIEKADEIMILERQNLLAPSAYLEGMIRLKNDERNDILRKKLAVDQMILRFDSHDQNKSLLEARDESEH